MVHREQKFEGRGGWQLVGWCRVSSKIGVEGGVDFIVRILSQKLERRLVRNDAARTKDGSKRLYGIGVCKFGECA